jgi:hypothetical protein
MAEHSMLPNTEDRTRARYFDFAQDSSGCLSGNGQLTGADREIRTSKGFNPEIKKLHPYSDLLMYLCSGRFEILRYFF